MDKETSSSDYQFSSYENVECPAGEACPWPEEVRKLEEQLLTDPLTGIANYRHFSRALEQEMERTRRSGASTSLIMLDIDFFKSINDNYGHEAGNMALQALANCMLSSFRKLDVVCRYGGEEFAIILPATEALVAVQVAERLRKNIEAMDVTVCNQQGDTLQINMTASLGIGIYTRHSKVSPKELVQEADDYLYKAKNEGRNKVCYGIHKVEAEAEVSNDEKDALNSLFGGDD
ncbi:GGDEF domain-containing protein [Pseudoteredinibacter isoporae]|uniref:diguanylate cyclase n=1 Tax=Pseudoteredinibacter isoporae TaxID=570281 RepID=A0A7X0JSK1_9GAMM|nr:GGDEF domain-containing protein [Pseudoteredinibacter isoporae]MBB6520898.1 diguanylate cyclase (GGDEF)-like protein [Pseudoteredinibacter isoporae]NHO86463.1 GGDEF domain-containing protein [Pseudoteredinibacter isoporae]NIB25085.1 GGDEF domain-containing protein [Pseudoteredinibacter isoporae]